jgi:hypothetical protein
MHQIKPGLRRQDLKGIHLHSWKLKKLCHSAEDVMALPCDFTAVCHDSKTKKIESTKFHLFPRKSK